MDYKRFGQHFFGLMLVLIALMFVLPLSEEIGLSNASFIDGYCTVSFFAMIYLCFRFAVDSCRTEQDIIDDYNELVRRKSHLK